MHSITSHHILSGIYRVSGRYSLFSAARMIMFYKYYILVAETNSIVHEIPKESNLSVAIAVPLALLVIIVVLVFTLTVRYNTYYNMWYRVNVLQRLKSALYNKGL